MVFAGLTLDVDATALVALALIIFPFVILNGLVFKPFLELFEKRHDRIEGAVERANQKLEEAERQAEAFEEQIEAAKRKGLEKRNAIRAAAQTAMNEKIAEEQSSVEQRVKQSLAEIAKEKEGAMSTVSAEAHRLADITASKLLGRNI